MKHINTFEDFLNESQLNEAKLHPVNAEYIKQIDTWIESLKRQLEDWPSRNAGANKSKRDGIKELKAERAAIVKSGEVQYPDEPMYPSISY